MRPIRPHRQALSRPRPERRPDAKRTRAFQTLHTKCGGISPREFQRPRNWPGWQDLTARRSSFFGRSRAGIVVTVLVFAAAFFWWRGAAGPERAAPEGGPARRGGQLIFSVRAEPRSFNRL